MSNGNTVSVARLDKPASVAAGPRTRGGYYWRRGPLEGAQPVSADTGGYLNASGTRFDEGAFCTLRVYPCHEFKGRHDRPLIEHEGWFTDDDGCRETIYGIVARLPHGRGFLAGWTMGAGMCATLSRTIYHEEREAVYAADRAAERTAEAEREYQRKWQAARQVEDMQREIEAGRSTHSELIAELRTERAMRARLQLPERTAVCQALQRELARERSDVSRACARIRALIAEHGQEITGSEFQ